MKVTWEVSDGYAGGTRTQTTIIDDDELNECETDQEREDLIAECVQDDFNQSITWYETNRE